MHALHRLMWVTAVILYAKVLVGVLAEYRWYLPPDFDASAYLSGRKSIFHGSYRIAFYAHIFSGPIAVLLAAFLMASGGRLALRRWHQRAGRVLAVCVLGLVVPSGWVMARKAYAGPIAAYGFTSLTLATAVSLMLSVHYARVRALAAHRLWATRCFLLLSSPLLLRVFSGAAIVTGLESEWSYRFNAWFSWLIPLAIYQAYVARAMTTAQEQSHTGKPLAVGHRLTKGSC